MNKVTLIIPLIAFSLFSCANSKPIDITKLDLYKYKYLHEHSRYEY